MQISVPYCTYFGLEQGALSTAVIHQSTLSGLLSGLLSGRCCGLRFRMRSPACAPVRAPVFEVMLDGIVS